MDGQADDRKPEAKPAPTEDVSSKAQKVDDGVTAGATARDTKRQLKYKLPPAVDSVPPLFAPIGEALDRLLDPMLGMIGADEEGKTLYELCRKFRRYCNNARNAPKEEAWMHRDPILQCIAFMAKQIGNYADARGDSEALKKLSTELCKSAALPTGDLQKGTEGAVAYALYPDQRIDRNSVKQHAAVNAMFQWTRLLVEDGCLFMQCRYCNNVFRKLHPVRKDKGFLNQALYCEMLDNHLLKGGCEKMDDGHQAFMRGLVVGEKAAATLMKYNNRDATVAKHFAEGRLTMMRYVLTKEGPGLYNYQYDFGHEFTKKEQIMVEEIAQMSDGSWTPKTCGKYNLDFNDPDVKAALKFKVESITTKSIPSVLSESSEIRGLALSNADETLKRIRMEYESAMQK